MSSKIETNEAIEQGSGLGAILPARENYPNPELSLTISIVMAGRRWRSLIDEHLRQAGHSASRMEAMASIAYAPAEATQIRVAKRIGIEGPTLTRTLDLLEADGLVERLPDPNDRRNKHMRLTEAGFEALAAMFKITHRLRTRLLDGLPAGEIAQVDQFLTQLVQRMDEGLEPDSEA